MSNRHLAYLDPGSAGVVLQMLVGAVAAGALTVKLTWRRMLRFLHLGRRDEATLPEERSEGARGPDGIREP